MNKLIIIDRGGPEEFEETLAFQNELIERLVENRTQPDSLVFVEHDDVYTMGRSEPAPEFLLPLPKKVRTIETNRGGKVTYHGPGQLVAYPVFDLEKHGKDVHVLMRKIEEAVIHALRLLGLKGEQVEGLTGVWVETKSGEKKKVASIGVGVKKWVSYHGLALNVTPDMTYFRAISPCGQSGEVMTSLQELFVERGEAVPSMQNVKEVLAASFLEVFELEIEQGLSNVIPRHRPKWLKVKAPGSPDYMDTFNIVKGQRLVTVCEEAMCPNIGECWSHHTATFMIMGDLCTRRCSFCSVKDGTIEMLKPLDTMEPYRVGFAVKELGLKHVVITSVNRDDLDDMGAEHFNQTIKAIHSHAPDCGIELLIPDMRGNTKLVEMILQSGFVSVLNHNVETVPSLYKRVRPGAAFARSLKILKHAKEFQPSVKTKSGLMVGLGEKKEEVIEVMEALRSVGVSILTVGQYLQPTKKQLEVERFVTPEEFAEYKRIAGTMGFAYVESGPLVRSSYHAWEHAEGAKAYEAATASV